MRRARCRSHSVARGVAAFLTPSSWQTGPPALAESEDLDMGWGGMLAAVQRSALLPDVGPGAACRHCLAAPWTKHFLIEG